MPHLTSPPPLPGRNPRRPPWKDYHSRRKASPCELLPGLELKDTETELLPRPLTVPRKKTPPLPPPPVQQQQQQQQQQRQIFEDVIHVKVFELGEGEPPSPVLSLQSLDSHSSSSSSSTASSTSSASSASTCSSRGSTTDGEFPATPPRPWIHTPWMEHWMAPKQRLRRVTSPREESLRGIRNRESDACLQRLYDECTVAYLEGRVFGELDVILEM